MTPVRPDPARSVRHGVVYTMAVAVQGFSTLLVLPFALTLLGPAEYGQVAVGLSIVQIGTVLAAAGLPLAITRAYFDEHRGLERARALAGLLSLVSLALLVASTASLRLWASVVAPGVGYLTLLASLGSVGAIAIATGSQAILRAEGRPSAFAATALGATAGAHVIALLLALWTPSAHIYMSGYLLGAGITAAASTLITQPRLPWSVPGSTLEGVRVGLPVLPHSIALLVLTTIDPILVNRLIGTTDAGRYQAAMLLGLAPLSLLIGVNNAWAPAVLGTPAESRFHFLAKSAVPMVALACAFTIGAALIAPVAVRVLAYEQPGPEELTRLVQVIALSTLGYIAYLATSIVLFSAKRTFGLALVTPTCAAALLVLGPIAIHMFGLIGMAGAKVVCFGLLGLGTYLAARRVVSVGWPYYRIAVMGAGTIVTTILLVAAPSSRPAILIEFGLGCLLGLGIVIALVRRVTRS